MLCIFLSCLSCQTPFTFYRYDRRRDNYNVEDGDFDDDGEVDNLKDDDDDILSSRIYGSSPSWDDEMVPHETNHPVLAMIIMTTETIANDDKRNRNGSN